MSDADQVIADALRDIAAGAGDPKPMADAAWRTGRRRRLAALAASAASVGGAIALVLIVALPLAGAPGPVSAPRPSIPLASITLSPATPASPHALTTAAQLLRQRAARLDLPDIRIQVVGSAVVLTGPAAAEAELETLATAGVLNFRQVLLYQPYSGAASVTYGNASMVNQRTLALFGKLACTPDNTSTWKGQVGYGATEDYDNPDTQVVSCDSNGNKYALDVAKVPGTQISNAVAMRQPAPGDQWVVALTLKSEGATALGRLTTEQTVSYFPGAQAGNQNDRWLDTIAVILDGNVISTPQTVGPIPDGIAEIGGNFTRTHAEELAADLQSGALPVDFRVSSISTYTP